MNILQKSLAIIVSTVVVSVAGTYAASVLTLLSGYLQLEEAATRADAERAVNVFNDQNRGILLSARAYAFWDDMYKVIQEPDQEFIRSLNLGSQLFQTHKANLIAILDENYNPLYRRHLDLVTLEDLPVPPDLEQYLTQGSPLLSHSTENPEILGVISVMGKPMVLASLAGMHTDFSGPPKGAVIFGRYVDEQTAWDVALATKMEVNFFPPGAPDNPGDVFRAAQELMVGEKQSSGISQALDSQRIAGYALVKTMDGKPAFILRVILPRDIYAQGLASFTYFGLYAGISGLVFILVLVLLMKKLILFRLTDLSHQVRQILVQSDDSRRVNISGGDEITQLAENINRMLSGLEKEKHSLKEANRELEAFSYSLTHHLKAPILSIGGFSELLRQEHSSHLDERGMHFLTRISESSASMAKLVGDLIDFSAAGKAVLNPVPVDLSAMAARIVEELRASPMDRKTEVMIQPGLQVVADEKYLRICLAHLMQNAFKYTSRTEAAAVEVGITEIHKSPAFFIRDNGAGFDMKYADQLFLPFRPLHNPKEFTGTGLGLAIVQRIIARHGGRVWAESSEGKGATFYFQLEDR